MGFVPSYEIYHIILLWVSSHAFHSIPLSIFRQSIRKFLPCARLGAIENNNVLALVTKTKDLDALSQSLQSEINILRQVTSKRFL